MEQGHDYHNHQQHRGPQHPRIPRHSLRRGHHSLTNIFGGRSAGYEDELQNAREEALRELERRAADLGANAVVGVDVDYEVLGSNNGMLMVSASGTAVVID